MSSVLVWALLNMVDMQKNVSGREQTRTQKRAVEWERVNIQLIYEESVTEKDRRIVEHIDEETQRIPVG